MDRRGEGTTTVVDLEAILDRAIASEAPPPRPQTKTEQLRGLRDKIAVLRAKGFTLVQVATMLGTSKDTLRQALRGPVKGKKKKAATIAQQSAKPSKAAAHDEEPVPKVRKATPQGGNSGFPSNDRF
jgi:lambda repressor-like predicted transcriptional regulator